MNEAMILLKTVILIRQQVAWGMRNRQKGWKIRQRGWETYRKFIIFNNPVQVSRSQKSVVIKKQTFFNKETKSAHNCNWKQMINIHNVLI